MLRRLAHAISTQPMLYDAIQFAAGSRTCYARLRAMLPTTADKRVLDLGGGTGISLASLDVATDYMVADVDLAKLNLLRQKHPSASAICVDGSRLPARANSFDVGLLIFVCHHLDDSTLDAVLKELARVCTERVFIMDPIWAPKRLRGRLLWRYDEGRHPRTVAQLDGGIRRHFTVYDEDSFAIHHEYHIWCCDPRVAG